MEANKVATSTDKSKAGGVVPFNTIVDTVTPDERQHMIAEAAYFHAEHRAFQGGSPEQDWLQAEVEIDNLLAS